MPGLKVLLLVLLLFNPYTLVGSESSLSDSTITTLLYRTSVNAENGLTPADISMVIEWAENVEHLPRFHKILFNLVMDGRASIFIDKKTRPYSLTFIISQPPRDPDGG